MVDGPQQVADLGDGKTFRGAGRRFDGAGRHGGGAPLGQHQPLRPEHFGAAGDGSQIVRIGDAVEQDEQRRLAAALGSSEQIVEPRVAKPSR